MAHYFIIEKTTKTYTTGIFSGRKEFSTDVCERRTKEAAETEMLSRYKAYKDSDLYEVTKDQTGASGIPSYFKTQWRTHTIKTKEVETFLVETKM